MKNKGITLIALTITIIILAIIAGISINIGKNMIKKANLEALKTNMLLIKSKGKEYVENANFKLGPNIQAAGEDKTSRIENAKLELGDLVSNEENIEQVKSKIKDNNVDNEYTFYSELTKDKLEEMGIKGIQFEEDEEYIIKYDINTMDVEVYNIPGFDGKNSLTDIDNIEV